MGSGSDWDVMEPAVVPLEEFGIEVEKRVISAHRAPHALMEWAESARERGLRVIIAGAGGAAHLAGVIAGLTTLPVIGVPVRSKTLDGLDSLLYRTDAVGYSGSYGSNQRLEKCRFARYPNACAQR